MLCLSLAQAGMAALRSSLSLVPPRCLHTACSLANSNRVAVSRLQRQAYGRQYPLLLVKTDDRRFHRPHPLQGAQENPHDSNTLPEAERKARLRRQFPTKLRAKEEEDAFDKLDMEKYKKFWKK
ncbi:39S ribosomal protein L55, mitochondrial [Anas platyrhynchos]|uniref:39S ribosomal protein L55, mitochondrial n=1 Tax=Anas platyrhynchos TaxID=8839 RepID=R0JM77_ANAPL|nr:39S ribosomal protein L55, mitochondrial [Anas platyrhynchos]